MSVKYCVIILVLIKSSGADDNDLFSSTADLTRLRNLETKFISDLQALAAKLEEEQTAVRRRRLAHQLGDSGDLLRQPRAFVLPAARSEVD